MNLPLGSPAQCCEEPSCENSVTTCKQNCFYIQQLSAFACAAGHTRVISHSHALVPAHVSKSYTIITETSACLVNLIIGKLSPFDFGF